MKQHEITLSRGNLAAAGEGRRDDLLLRKLFGENLEKILALDPEPMIVLATDLLDKGDIRNGQQSWVMGWYKVWMTTEQFVTQMAPAYKGAPGYANHRMGNEWGPHLWTVLEMGLDERTGSPAAYLYVEPQNEELRTAIRLGVAQNDLGRKFKLSLHLFAESNAETLQVTKFVDEEQWSLDMVRRQGTKSAKISQALALAGEIEGEGTMLTFETFAQMFAHADVQAEMTRRIDLAVQQAMREPARIKEIVLAAADELVLEHKAVQPLTARPPSRDAVLQSVKPEELEIVLGGSVELRGAAVKQVETLQKKETEFRGKAAEILLKEIGDPRIVEITLGTHDFSHCDEAKVEAEAKAIRLVMQGGVAGNGSAGGVVSQQQTAKAGDTGRGAPPDEKAVAADLERNRR